MTQPLLIALVAVLFIREANPSVFGGEPADPRVVYAVTLGAPLLIAALAHAFVRRCARRLGTPRGLRSVVRAEHALLVARVATVAVHADAVLRLGWLETVRDATGDLIVLDEFLAILPPLLVFVAGWWSFYPIERRLHEALLVRSLDEGRAVYPAPSRAVYVADRLRHQLLLILAPLAILVAWSEALSRLAPRLERAVPAFADPEIGPPLFSLCQFAGAILVFVLAPPIVRLIWSTVPLGPGPLRDRLQALCDAHGVRVRRMLVWRTHGMMINGAVLGIVGRLRYILLTDALLDSLPTHQIEAVMAHEVAHIRRHHLPWLLVAMVAGLGLALAAILTPTYALVSLLDLPLTISQNAAISAAATLVALSFALVAFGYVSRRFERQADAFAAQHLSGMTRANKAAGVTITTDAAEAMAGALQAVAELNHIAPGKFTWRHGSIAGRQRAIRSLIGRPADRLPIDAAVRRLKLLSLAVLLAVAALTVIDARVGLAPEPRFSGETLVSGAEP